ncbi:spore germination protein KB [Paenibacillus phyllosphaerae]|uniref:Spore germination protein KB n=1 Tax=Paenibacillus phyllosphaerae TaxID=274593 RepID=A0A7W5FPC4_9BACL|nr:GerAB/ArcD/ProY family transporter [Paenibacillus phyllosphaerae]MBB3112108.1 spore germination protein KB [Paenibacillus phyllosphaerae]
MSSPNVETSTDRVGKYQLMTAIIMFEIGSTPMFLLGIKAGQNAWMAMAVGAVAGLLVLVPCLYLQRLTGDTDWTEMLLQRLGKWAGGLVALFYALLLAYESMRNVRDFGEMANGTILPQTPKWVIMIVITTIACYAVRKGIFVLFRTIELFFPTVVMSYTTLVLFFFISDLPSVHRLRPILDKGIGQVLGEALPELISFPFGQVFVFLLFWKYVKSGTGFVRTSLAAYGVVSLFLTIMSVLTLSILGADVAQVVAYPFLEAVQLIHIADFLERLDIFVTLIIFLGLFVKLAVFYLASNLMVSRMTGLPERTCGWFLGIVIFAASFLEPSQTFHIWLGLKVQVKYVWIFQMLMPILILALTLISKRRGQASC